MYLLIQILEPGTGHETTYFKADPTTNTDSTALLLGPLL